MPVLVPSIAFVASVPKGAECMTTYPAKRDGRFAVKELPVLWPFSSSHDIH